METSTTQEECMKTMSEPRTEHQWLQRLVGEWVVEGEATMEPGKPPMKYKGTESVRTLGGLWILAEGQGEMPGCGVSTAILTLGFDTQKQRFVGTFIASMMTNLWVYDGALDEAGGVLTLNTEGPNMAAGGKLGKYKDVIEIQSQDRRTLTSHLLGDDGQWHAFMTAEYRRVK